MNRPDPDVEDPVLDEPPVDAAPRPVDEEPEEEEELLAEAPLTVELPALTV